MKQLIFIAILLLSGCSMDDKPTECTPAAIDREQYVNADSDPFDFEDIRLTSDGCLQISLRYGGGCGKVSAVLVDSGDVLESDPPQRKLRLIFTDNDDCEASLKKDLYFDINSLQLEDSNEVLLQFTGTDLSFLYQY